MTVSDKASRRSRTQEYKQRKETGGVCVIRNTRNGRYLLQAGREISRMENRFNFSKQTGSCVHLKVKKDWEAFGPEAFEFEMLEQIERKDSQTPEQFQEDLDALLRLYAEQSDPALSY
jgi:hypothetical protein